MNAPPIFVYSSGDWDGRGGRGGQHRFGILVWLVGEFTTHFRTYLGSWIGMSTGGMIRVLTHGHIGPSPCPTSMHGLLHVVSSDDRRVNFQALADVS